MKKFLLFLVLIALSNYNYSQKIYKFILFNLDTTDFKRQQNIFETDVSYNNLILKKVVYDTLKKKKLEFLRIDRDEYFLIISNNLDVVLEEGKVSLSKTPFFKKGENEWFCFEKNGSWRESLIDSIFKIGEYKNNQKVGIWTNSLSKVSLPLSQDIFKSDTIKSSRNLNKLEVNRNEILNSILGQWGMIGYESPSDTVWTFKKLNPSKKEFSSKVIEFFANSNLKFILWNHHRSSIGELYWEIESKEKIILLKNKDGSYCCRITYLNDKILVLNIRNPNQN